MRKNNKIVICITTEQKEIVKKRAKECGLSLSAYCTYLLINARPKIEDVNGFC